MTLDDQMSGFIGRRIQAFRERRGWSLEQLAAASGTSKSYLSQLEKGRHSVTKAKLCAIAAALGVSEDDLDGRAERDDGFLEALQAVAQQRGVDLRRLDVARLRASLQWRSGELHTREEWRRIYAEVLPAILEHLQTEAAIRVETEE